MPGLLISRSEINRPASGAANHFEKTEWQMERFSTAFYLTIILGDLSMQAERREPLLVLVLREQAVLKCQEMSSRQC